MDRPPLPSLTAFDKTYHGTLEATSTSITIRLNATIWLPTVRGARTSWCKKFHPLAVSLVEICAIRRAQVNTGLH